MSTRLDRLRALTEGDSPPPPSRLARLAALAEEPANPAVGRTPYHTLARSALRGLAESGYALAEGIGRLGNAVTGTEHVDLDALQRERRRMQEFYGEPVGAGKAAYMGARLGGDLAQFAAPGAAASRLGLLPRGAGFAARVGVNTAVTAPVTVAQAASPEGSTTSALAEVTGSERLRRLASSMPGRIVGDLAGDLLLGGAAEGVGTGVRAFRDARGLPSADALRGSRLVDDELALPEAEVVVRGRRVADETDLRAGAEDAGRRAAGIVDVGPGTTLFPSGRPFVPRGTERPEPVETLARSVRAPADVEPERIAGAAVRSEDGRYFVDSDHGSAFARAEDAGAAPAENGFWTSRNRFVTRAEADELAQQTGQAQRPAAEHGLDSQDLSTKERLAFERGEFRPGEGRIGAIAGPLQTTLARAGVGAAAGAAADLREGEDSPLDGLLAGAGLGMVATTRAGRDALWQGLQRGRQSLVQAAQRRAPNAANFLFTGETLPEAYAHQRYRVLPHARAEAMRAASDVAQKLGRYGEDVQRLLFEAAESGGDRLTVARGLEGAGVEGSEQAAETVEQVHSLFSSLGERLFATRQLSRESLDKFGGRYVPHYPDPAAAAEAAGEAPRAAFGARGGVRITQEELGRTKLRTGEMKQVKRDLRYAATRGLAEEGALAAKSEFFLAVRGMEDVVDTAYRDASDAVSDLAFGRQAIPPEATAARRVAETAALEKGYVKLPDREAYGTMRGLYVRPDVAEDLKGMVEPIAWTNSFLRLYDTWHRRWKFGKTVLNPSTHARNAYGSQILSWLGGGPKPFSKVARESYAAVRSGQGPLYEEGVRAGLFDSSVYQDVVQDALDQVDDLTRRAAQGPVRQGVQRGLDAAAKHYQDIDFATRLAHYRHRLAKGATPDEAAALARKWVPTYERQSDFTKVMSRLVPFFGYTAAALPLIAEAAVKNPHKMLFAGALTYGLNRLFYGEDLPEDIKPRYMRGGALRRALPRMIPNPIPQLTGENKGERNYLDATYMMPWGDLGDVGGVAGVPFGIPSQINPATNFIAKPVLEMLAFNRDMRTGQDIFSISQKTPEKLGVAVDRLYKHLLPSLTPGLPGPIEGGYSWEKLRDAATGTPNDYTGIVPRLPATVADVGLGFKNRTIDVRDEYEKRLDEVDRMRQDLRLRNRRNLRKASWSQTDKDEWRTKFNERMRELNQETARLHALSRRVPELR